MSSKTGFTQVQSIPHSLSAHFTYLILATPQVSSLVSLRSSITVEHSITYRHKTFDVSFSTSLAHPCRGD
jgi:hypothetical protein